MSRRCKNCFQPLGDLELECSNCGASNTLPAELTADGSEKTTEVIRPMRYYKFLIWFWLFASCAMFFYFALGNGAWVLTYTNEIKQFQEWQENPPYGTFHLEEEPYADEIAELNEDRNWAIAMAMASAIMGVWALVVRNALANYRTSGPVRLSAYLVACIIWFVFLGIFTGRGDPMSILWFQFFTGIPAAVVNIICIICNKVYFDKRYNQFCW